LKNEYKMKILTKKILLIFTVIISFCSCENTPSRPSGAIDEQTMAKILAEIHFTESKVSRLSFRDNDSSMVVYKVLEEKILKKYQTDTVRYRASYNYYVTKPETMIQIYDNAIKNIEEMRKNSQKSLKK